MSKKTNTILVYLVGAVALGFAWFFGFDQKQAPVPADNDSVEILGGDEVLGAGEESLFAQIDENGNVLRVIVIAPEVLATGRWGDPKSWVRTYKDGRLRGNYAGIGHKYDKTKDAFIPPKVHDSWVLDNQTFQWKAPIPKPNDGKKYIWDEATTNWKLQ